VSVDTFAAIDYAVDIDSMRAGQFFPRVFRYFMKPGEYKLRASLYQYREIPEETAHKTIQVGDYTIDELKLSSVQLGSDLSLSEEQSFFVKNGYRLVPNPTRFFGTQLPLFYYYVEVYNLSHDEAAQDSLALFRTVYRADREVPVRPETKRVYQKSGTSAVLTDGFPIYTMLTGSYRLVLRVLDYATGEVTTTEKRFFCYRPDDFAHGRMPLIDDSVKTQLLQSSIDILEIIEPDSAIRLMHYLFDSRREEKRILAYSNEAKRQYLEEYWGKRELTEPDAANKYFARVAAANQRYGFLNHNGWKTDRGRVLVMYGEPDNIIRRYEEAHLPDHEVWQYERLEGGVEFIFMDKSGFGNLELVHSTKSGELKNPNWPEYAPGATGDTGGSRLR
jgi:GWxTD domain-containing protein